MTEPIEYDALPMAWVGDWAGRRRALSPDRIAVVDGDTGARWTYRQLDERADRVGSWLTKTAGLQRGDVICMLSRNRIEAIDLYLAAGKVGVVLAPLSHRLAAPELDDLLRRLRPRVLFHEQALAELADALTLPDSVAERVGLGDDAGAYRDQVLATAPEPANVALALRDPFLYVHTGGTTATPKICVVSHRQMVWNSIELILAAPEGLAGRHELLTFPLFHIGGWNTLTPVLHGGGRAVLMRQFDPGLALRLIAAERIDHFGAVEAMLRFLLQHPDFPAADLSSLRAITTAAAPCSEAVMQPFWERGIQVGQSYGQTEAGPSNFINGRLDGDWDAMRKYHGSIGTSFFHCDYRIAGPAGEAVAPGETGELWLRSPHGFDGYLDEPERTAAVLDAEGWVHTGDMAREDAEGFVYIAGRADNMFVSGGENVSPEEIETVLREHPAVDQAAVFGIPDERWGQVPMAVLVATTEAPATDTLVQWLSARLARYKVPKRFAFAEALPLTGAGKVDRNAARRRYFDGQQDVP